VSEVLSSFLGEEDLAALEGARCIGVHLTPVFCSTVKRTDVPGRMTLSSRRYAL